MATTLPAEIMDVVIDQLCSDLPMLGVCGMVCSEWLIRSRHHIFSTVHLWPWRVRRFFELAHSQKCTFTQYVNRIELDDAQSKNQNQSSKRTQDHGRDDDDEFLFHRVMSSSSLSRFSHIQSMRIRNVDWTMFPFSEQGRLRERLATFTRLKALEFDDVMFHDFREVALITALFPSLNNLVANLQFSKYIEHTISSATTLTLPNGLETLSLGSDDGIPTILSTTFRRPSALGSLTLKGVKFWHLQYIGSALRQLGDSLRHFEINFSREEGQWINNNDLAKLDLTHQTRLQSLHLTGIILTTQTALCALETDVPFLLSKIPSSKHLKNVTLGLAIGSCPALELLDWNLLDRVVRKMDRCKLNLDIDISAAATTTDAVGDREFVTVVESFVSDKLINLRRGGRLGLVVKSNRKEL